MARSVGNVLLWVFALAVAIAVASAVVVPLASFYSSEMRAHSGVAFNLQGLAALPSAILFSILVTFNVAAMHLTPAILLFAGWELLGRKPSRLLFSLAGGASCAITWSLVLLSKKIIDQSDTYTGRPDNPLLDIGFFFIVGAIAGWVMADFRIRTRRFAGKAASLA